MPYVLMVFEIGQGFSPDPFRLFSFFFLSLEVFNEDTNLRLYSNWVIPTATINYLASRWP